MTPKTITEAAPTHVVDRAKPGVLALLKELKVLLDRIDEREPDLNDAERTYRQLRQAQDDDKKATVVLQNVIVQLSSGSTESGIGCHGKIVNDEARRL